MPRHRIRPTLSRTLFDDLPDGRQPPLRRPGHQPPLCQPPYGRQPLDQLTERAVRIGLRHPPPSPGFMAFSADERKQGANGADARGPSAPEKGQIGGRCASFGFSLCKRIIRCRCLVSWGGAKVATRARHWQGDLSSIQSSELLAANSMKAEARCAGSALQRSEWQAAGLGR